MGGKLDCRKEEETEQRLHMIFLTSAPEVTLRDRIINARYEKSTAVVEVVKKVKLKFTLEQAKKAQRGRKEV